MTVTYRIDAMINGQGWQEIGTWAAEIEANPAGLPPLNAQFGIQPMGQILGHNQADLRLTRIH